MKGPGEGAGAMDLISRHRSVKRCFFYAIGGCCGGTSRPGPVMALYPIEGAPTGRAAAPVPTGMVIGRGAGGRPMGGIPPPPMPTWGATGESLALKM